MVCTAVRKWHKISPIVETYQEDFKKQDAVKDYLHKVTRWLAEYCKKRRDKQCDQRYPKISVKEKR